MHDIFISDIERNKIAYSREELGLYVSNQCEIRTSSHLAFVHGQFQTPYGFSGKYPDLEFENVIAHKLELKAQNYWDGIKPRTC